MPSADATELVALVREIAAEQPEYVYTSPQGIRADDPAVVVFCKYAHSDGPGCIVGQALHRMGFDIAELREFDRVGNVRSLADDGIITGNNEDIRWLIVAQTGQDRGDAWSASVAFADAARLPSEVAE